MKRHFDDPPIEILSGSDRLPLLQARLSRGRMRPCRALTPLRLDYTAPLLIDMKSAPDPHMLRDYIHSWYAADRPRLLVILGPRPEGLGPRDAIELPEADDLLTLRDRISIRQREALCQAESDRRSLTAQSLGAKAPPAMQERYTHRLLYLGESGADFVRLKAALQALGGEVAAALSPTMAIDYLAQHRFSAILLAPGGAPETISRFLDLHDPVCDRPAAALIHLQTPRAATSTPPLSADRFDLVLPRDRPGDALAQTIMAHLPAPVTPLKPRQGGDVGIEDVATGLFSPAFLKAHLAALITEVETSGQPLSVLHLSPAKMGMSLKALAEQVRLNLREYDLAARLDANTLCIVMPDTPYRAGLSVALRLEALCERALVWRLTERRRSQDAEALLDTRPVRSKALTGRRLA